MHPRRRPGPSARGCGALCRAEPVQVTLRGPGLAGSGGGDRRAFTGRRDAPVYDHSVPPAGHGSQPGSAHLVPLAPPPLGSGARQWGVVAELAEASCRPLGEPGSKGRPEEAAEAEGRGARGGRWGARGGARRRLCAGAGSREPPPGTMRRAARAERNTAPAGRPSPPRSLSPPSTERSGPEETPPVARDASAGRPVSGAAPGDCSAEAGGRCGSR